MNDIINELTNIQSGLMQIFTSGQNSFILTDCEKALQNVINELNERAKFESIKVDDSCDITEEDK